MGVTHVYIIPHELDLHYDIYIYIYVCVFSPFQEFSIFVIPTWLPFGAAVYVSGIRNSSQYFPFSIFWGDFPGSLAPSEASFQ